MFWQVLNILLCLCSRADNGVFEGPGVDSYRKLTLAQHRAFQKEVRKLLAPDYMQVRIAVTNDERYIGPSYYATPAGRAELQGMAADVLNHSRSYDEVVFIGRSGQGLKAYLEGVLDRHGESANPRLHELPYSNNEPRTNTAGQKAALRRHLEENGLSPRQIIDRGKRVLFMDMVYSGTGIDSLLAAIHDWAKDLGIGRALLKSKLGVYGVYPARMLTVNNLMKLNHASLGEGATVAITEERVAQEMSWRHLPGSASYYAGDVYERQISDKLYDYAGNLTRHPNESFTPDKWAQPLARSGKLSFGEHAGDAAYAEMYYLIQEGRRESVAVLKTVAGTRAKCEKTLRGR
ncbi:MAG: hypothetical protein HY074_20955 [Deltaproteobacteria bacterium]|nr:hypothetical protein [Deltaproteobacteria bacterium]